MRQRTFAEQVPPLVEKPWQSQASYPVVKVSDRDVAAGELLL
jgi:hypothetical protein